MENELLQAISQLMDEKLEPVSKRLDNIEFRVTKTEVLLENEIFPAIKLLAEGQKTIQNQIKKLSVIDSMQDDIATLKTAVKFLSQEVDKLQKAM